MQHLYHFRCYSLITTQVFSRFAKFLHITKDLEHWNEKRHGWTLSIQIYSVIYIFKYSAPGQSFRQVKIMMEMIMNSGNPARHPNNLTVKPQITFILAIYNLGVLLILENKSSWKFALEEWYKFEIKHFTFELVGLWCMRQFLIPHFTLITWLLESDIRKLVSN